MLYIASLPDAHHTPAAINKKAGNSLRFYEVCKRAEVIEGTKIVQNFRLELPYPLLKIEKLGVIIIRANVAIDNFIRILTFAADAAQTASNALMFMKATKPLPSVNRKQRFFCWGSRYS
ncbi:MAG: hypothetical protein E7445_01865 [Ruminococcaceae bacterium]|nr:hypothetical protein [Oscillospiraceae bacterium]